MSVRTSTRHNSVDVCINAGIDRHAESFLYTAFITRRSGCDSPSSSYYLTVYVDHGVALTSGWATPCVRSRCRLLRCTADESHGHGHACWLLGVWGGGSRGTRPEHAQRRYV